MRNLVIIAVLATTVAASTGWAFTPVVTALPAFSYYTVRNIQTVFGFRGLFRGRGSAQYRSGYGPDSNYGMGGGQFGTEQYRTRGD